MKQFFLLMSIILFWTMQTWAASPLVPACIAYIDQFEQTAVNEMHYSGIPASVTLAQAILESKYGTSTLAKKSNNHFGIKCKVDWIGASVRFTDDAPDECFRKYETIKESYRDHSNFIKNNRLNFYDFLFELNKTDYVNWAKGLKSAGYATLPDYDHQLIRIIEKYDLTKYDYYALTIPYAAFKQEVVEVNQKLNQNFASAKEVTYHKQTKTGIRTEQAIRKIPAMNQNTVHRIALIHTARHGETLSGIASLYSMSIHYLRNLNLALNANVILSSGTTVYLN